MKAQDKYGVAEAIKPTWLPLPPTEQLFLNKGEQVFGDMAWIINLCKSAQFCLDEQNHLHQYISMRFKGKLATITGRVTTSIPPLVKRVDAGAAPVRNSICILRNGGLGDVIMLTAMARDLQGLDWKVGIACSYEYAAAIAACLPDDIEVLAVPAKIDALANYEHIICWDAFELNIAHHQGNGAAMYAHIAGLELTDARPWLPMLQNSTKRFEHQRALAELRNGRKLVVMQLAGSTIAKSPPHTLMLDAALMLAKDYLVIVTSTEHDLQKCGIKPADLPQDFQLATDKSLGSTLDWMALVSCADVVIAPNSAALHIANAMDIPAVGLFCSTSTRWFPADMKMIALCGDCPQHPCKENCTAADAYNWFSMPCDNPGVRGYGKGWDAITVADIVAATEAQL